VRRAGAPTIFARGVISSEDVDPSWRNMRRARWVAENGIERLKTVTGNGFEGALGARAHLLAGYANRLMGEQVCFAVFDGGPAQDFRDHFRRAETHFSESLRIAAAINNTQLVNASRAGRASVRAALGGCGTPRAPSSMPRTAVTRGARSTTSRR
jgi:starch-binding outer membrane protein, SusD/RagB family